MFSYFAPLLPARIDSAISGTSQDLMAKDACGITGKILCEIGLAKSNLLSGPQSFREKVDDDWELVTVQLRAFAYREA